MLDLQAAVAVEDELLPANFFLDQNYPNPFNPSTSIRFGLNNDADVDLKIYDMLGREIAILINNEFKYAGTYNVTFDASKLASGTYIYKLRAGSAVESRKMTLVK